MVLRGCVDRNWAHATLPAPRTTLGTRSLHNGTSELCVEEIDGGARDVGFPAATQFHAPTSSHQVAAVHRTNHHPLPSLQSRPPLAKVAAASRQYPQTQSVSSTTTWSWPSRAWRANAPSCTTRRRQIIFCSAYGRHSPQRLSTRGATPHCEVNSRSNWRSLARDAGPDGQFSASSLVRRYTDGNLKKNGTIYNERQEPGDQFFVRRESGGGPYFAWKSRDRGSLSGAIRGCASVGCGLGKMHADCSCLLARSHCAPSCSGTSATPTAPRTM